MEISTVLPVGRHEAGAGGVWMLGGDAGPPRQEVSRQSTPLWKLTNFSLPDMRMNRASRTVVMATYFRAWLLCHHSC